MNLHLIIVWYSLLSAFALAEHDGDRSRSLVQTTAPSAPVREVAEKETKSVLSTVKARLEDPRWYCERGKIIEPRHISLNKLSEEERALHERSLLKGEKLFAALEELSELSLDTILYQLDTMRRKYPSGKEFSQIRMMELVRCMDSFQTPACSYYADAYLDSLQGREPSKSAHCLLAHSYALSQDQHSLSQLHLSKCTDEKRKKLIETKLAESTSPRSRLANVVSWGLADNQWTKDRFARLLLSFTEPRRVALLNEFNKAFGLTLTECDLLRPKTWLSEPKALGAFLKEPVLTGGVLESMAREPNLLANAITKDKAMEEALLRHFVSNPRLSRLRKELSQTTQERLKRIEQQIEMLPQPKQELVITPTLYPAFSSDKRYLFSPAKDIVQLQQQLNSPDWMCNPHVLTSRQVAKKALQDDALLKEQWNKESLAHEAQLLREASVAIDNWRGGKISTVDLLQIVDDLQDQIPEESSTTKERLRQMAIDIAPKSLQAIVEFAYKKRESLSLEKTREFFSLSLDPKSASLYRQLYLRNEEKDWLTPLGIREASSDSCQLISLDNPTFSEAAILVLEEIAARTEADIGNRAISLLIKAAGSRTQKERTAALRVLRQIGERAVPELIRTVGDSEPTAREGAALALRDMEVKTHQAIPALVKALGDPDPEVRDSISITLGRMGEMAVPHLILALGDKRQSVREAAAVALREMGDKAHQAIPALLKALEDSSDGVGLQASIILGSLRERAVPELIRTMSDSRAYVRGRAAAALGRSRQDEAVPALVKAMGDSSSEVRKEAALALGEFLYRTDEVSPALIKALGDSSEPVRAFAAEALGRVRAVKAIPALSKALGDSSAEVRESAATALANFGEHAQEAIPPLIKALSDSDFGVREAAATTLGGFKRKGDEAIPALIKALGDTNENVGTQAALSLRKIGGKKAVSAITMALGDSGAQARRLAAFAIGGMDEERTDAIPALIKLLGDSDLGVRDGAIYALKRIGKKAVPHLERAITSPNPLVKDQAEQLLQLLK